MNSKERVMTSINHKEPDRVPRTFTFTPEFRNYILNYYKLKVDQLHELDLNIGSDVKFINHGYADESRKEKKITFTDKWGISWRIVQYKNEKGDSIGNYVEALKNPLFEDDKIKNYIPPDPDKEDYSESESIIKKYGKDFAIVGTIVQTIFESAWALRGLGKLMMDFVLNEDLANRILDIPYNYHMVIGKELIKRGVDIILVGDDFGAQNGMMLSPEMWRQFFKPRMANMFNEFKKLNPDLKIAYHSDGNIYSIIDDFIEIGLDILNPIQPKSMDPGFLKNKYGKNLSFWGTIDIQETLPFGSIEDVRKEVKNRMNELAPGGGFIIAPSHNVQMDTPIENFVALIDAIDKYGKYPI
jgi:uroporphyrinogen decarboxylase